LVIYICYPIDHPHGLAMDVNLKTVPVIQPIICIVNFDTALTHCKNPVRHLKVDDLTAGKTFIFYLRIDVVSVPDESGK
jgi:hypothetical protein